MKAIKSLVILDIETTTSARIVKLDNKPAICSIAAMAIDYYPYYEIIEKFSQLVLFNQKRADPTILQLVGYDKNRWTEEAVHPLEAFENFKDFLSKYVWLHRVSPTGINYNTILPVGHNISGFDISVLRNWAKAIKKEYKPKNPYLPISFQPRVDTLELANMWSIRTQEFPYSYRLPDLCKFYGLEVKDHHEAMSDVEMSYQLLKHFSPMLQEDF